MIITTTDRVPKREVTSILGVVSGNTVRTKDFGSDFMAGLKSIVGGEIGQYTDLLSEAREEAYRRMIEQAEKLGADAVVNMRFMTSMISESMSELLAYGTAVKLS